MRHLPRYPIYIPSKGRADRCLTARFFVKDDVPFKIVVEPFERALYESEFGAERILSLPFENLGLGSIPARNWIKDHATAAGAVRHWCLDDNIERVARAYKGRRLSCAAGPALAAVEDFTDRYENVAISGLNYWAFGAFVKQPPLFVNVHVYSCMLILNSLPYRWRGRYNEDTDLCLQALQGGWCTILMNSLLVRKQQTMTAKGGNSAELYVGDGRLKMSRALERKWYGVVTTKRKFRRPQHHVLDQWRRFDTPLKLKPGIDLAALPSVDEYGLTLRAVGDVKHADNKRLLEEYKAKR